MDTLLVEQVERHQDAVANLRVYKARNETDSGWYFVAAKDPKEARRILHAQSRPYGNVVVATHRDLITIAARALTGNY